MKFDQIAFRCLSTFDHEQFKRDLCDTYGLSDQWIEDNVKAKGFVFPFHGIVAENVARLQFNYNKEGMEFEVIEYLGGPNFLDKFTNPISHFGIHMDSDEEFKKHFEWMYHNFQLVQHVHTIEHSNPYLIEKGRTYEYAIFNTIALNGTCTKLIRRIEGS